MSRPLVIYLFLRLREAKTSLEQAENIENPVCKEPVDSIIRRN